MPVSPENKAYAIWRTGEGFRAETYERLYLAIRAAKELVAKEDITVSIWRVVGGPSLRFDRHMVNIPAPSSSAWHREYRAIDGEFCDEHDDCYENEGLGRVCYAKSAK